MTSDRNLSGQQDLPDTRLLEGSATDFESSLLRAAIEEAPTQALSMQMLTPLATGAAATATVEGLGVLKWVLTGASVLVVGGAYYLGDSPVEGPQNSQKSEPMVDAAPQALPVEEVELRMEQSATPAQRPALEERKKAGNQSSAAAALPSKKAPSSLAGEMQLLDQARSALKSRKDPNEALRLLTTYERKYPDGALRPEATVLRVAALEESGAGDRADALKSEFLKAHPQSAHKKQLENGSNSEK